jgi:hypothetical protein
MAAVASHLNRLKPCEREFAVLEELALGSSLPGHSFRILQEYQCRPGWQHQAAKPESDQANDWTLLRLDVE